MNIGLGARALPWLRSLHHARITYCSKRSIYKHWQCVKAGQRSSALTNTPFTATGVVRGVSTTGDDDYSKLAEQFRNDASVKEWLSEINSDFGVNGDKESTHLDDPTGESNDGIVFEESSDSSSDSDSDSTEEEVDTKPNSSPRKSSSEYIIVEDGVVYDYEELDDNYTEIEEELQEVKLPISLERGKTGVFDLSELVKLLQFENGSDICVLKIPAEIQYVDHMVLVSARSHRHCKAVAASVRWCFKQKRGKKDVPSVDVEGSGIPQWLAMDLGNIALHVFMPETRAVYDLESLWTVGPEFDENTQREESLELDPFQAYLADFGKETFDGTSEQDVKNIFSNVESGDSNEQTSKAGLLGKMPQASDESKLA